MVGGEGRVLGLLVWVFGGEGRFDGEGWFSVWGSLDGYGDFGDFGVIEEDDGNLVLMVGLIVGSVSLWLGWLIFSLIEFGDFGG